MKVFETLKALGSPAACVVQVGAHEGQEVEIFRRHGVNRAIMIEPQDEAYDRLCAVIGEDREFIPVKAVCSSVDKETLSFFRGSNTQASSMLSPGRVLREHPKISFSDPTTMVGRSLDSLMQELEQQVAGFSVSDVDLLYMDTQGSELRVLMGACRLLHFAKSIWTEVSYDLYEGGASLEDIQGFLKPFGFRLNNFSQNAHRWGNALFLKDA